MRSEELNVVSQPVEGVRLIEANAGTGKTYAIQHLFLRLLLEGENPPGVKEILVVTFTDAAAAELRERIRGNVSKALAVAQGREAPPKEGSDLHGILSQCFDDEGRFDAKKLNCLKRAILEFDESAVSTIHGFCSKTLAENAFESAVPFDSELSSDADDALDRFVKDFWRRETYPKERAAVSLILKRKGCELPELLAFAKAVPDPETQFTPQESNFDEAELQRLLAELKKLWKEKAAEALELIAGSKCLSRSADSFKEENVAANAARMESFAAGEAPAPFGAIEFFSANSLDEAVTPAKKEKGERAPSHPVFALCQSVAGLMDACVAAIKLKLAAELASGVVRRLKNRTGVMGFDDLLLDLDAALRQPSGEALRQKLAARYRAVLIDEFQDTDPVQFRIFDLAFGGGRIPLFMIGDPKQSIYGFRRADVFSYNKVKNGKSSGPVLTLSRNFRSTPEMVAAVNAVFAAPSAKRPSFVFDGDWLSYAPSEPGDKSKTPLVVDGEPLKKPLRCVLLPGSEDGKPLGAQAAETAVLTDAAVRIAELLRKAREGKALFDDGRGERALEASDVAVLVNSNFNAARMKEELVSRGVPAVLQKSSDVFDTPEATALYKVLVAAARPEDPALVKEALCGSLLGVAPARVASFSLDGDGLEEFKLWLEWFSSLRSIWEEGGLVSALSSLLDAKPERLFQPGEELPEEMRRSVKSRLLSKTGGERAVSNLRQIAETLISKADAAKLDLEGQLSLLAKAIAEEDADEERECRLESDEDAVKVMTVHKSKGLQFPVVFAPLLWRSVPGEKTRDFRYHDEDLAMKFCLDAKADPSAAPACKEETLAELVRLVYVALTRASRLCLFHFGDIKDAGSSALAYLLGDSETSKENFLLAGIPCPSKEALEERLGSHGAVEAPLSLSVKAAPRSEEAKPSSFKAKFFERWSERIDNSRGVLSFSSVSAHQAPPLPRGEGEGGDEDPLSSFKRGAVAGECIHKFLELLDLSRFASGDVAGGESEALALAKDCVGAFGLAGRPGSRFHELREAATCKQLVSLAERLAFLPLDDVDGSGFALASIPKEKTCRELEFDYAVFDKMRQSELNALLESHGFEGARKRLGPRFDNVAGRLENDEEGGESVRRFVSLNGRSRRSGIMNGKIDLVFERAGRFHIIDWKSNWLGPSQADYSPERLFSDALANGYVLQYHIYALALHLHLTRALKGYDFSKHFGNVHYIYARGIGEGSGVFVDRPSMELLEALRESAQGGLAR